jgi:hypothetical protein
MSAHTRRNTMSSVAHGALHAILVGGVAAGVAAAAVLVLVRLAIGFAVFLVILLHTRSWHARVTRLFRRELWSALKISAFPLVGDRVFRPGFDLPIIALGLFSVLAFCIFLGIAFSALAYGLRKRATVVLALLFGFGMWGAHLVLINPAPATVIECIPAGLAMAYALEWYEKRYPMRR